MKAPKDIVKNGYDRVSFAYREDSPDRASESYKQYEAWITELSGYLHASSSVLDLGCGCGVPAAQLLGKRFRVTGVDISTVQIERARKLVPDARFILGDMSEVEFEPSEFDAVVCLYAIIHVPLAEQRRLLTNMSKWLKPGGLLLLSAGYREWTGRESDWLGVDGAEMYWSHADRDTYLDWLMEEGLVIVWDRFVPEANGGHPLFLARKGRSGQQMHPTFYAGD